MWSAARTVSESHPGRLRLSEVLGGLSYALDLTEGQRPGHSVRTCLIGMRLAEIVGLDEDDKSALFYALLMKDLGCSSNAARFAALFGANDHDVKTDIQHVDWPRALEAFRLVVRNTMPSAPPLKRLWRILGILVRGPEGSREMVRTRCEQGAEIAIMLGLGDATSEAIRALDEHWDGCGQPYGLSRERIPLAARIASLAQTVEVYFSSHGVLAAYDMVIARRGRWFDPALVDAFLSVRADETFWRELGSSRDLEKLASFEPEERVAVATEERLDQIADAFARVIDAKSPWTYRHSNGVADIAVAVGERLGLSGAAVPALRRAALLHDLGKLGISNLILDKPGALTAGEMALMRQHPAHTAEILRRASCFADLANAAASHHERLDGRGYHRGRAGSHLDLATRILCVADICDALRASRPYRAGLPAERVLSIMGRDAGSGIDPDCFAALRSVLLDHGAGTQVGAPAARFVPDLAEDYHQAA
jgi:putative nucleotidyltransferase with HDIG domain